MLLQIAYGMIDEAMKTKTWAMGDAFSMADCAAAPALFYANLVLPFADTHRNAAAYLGPADGTPVFRQGGQGSAAILRALPPLDRKALVLRGPNRISVCAYAGAVGSCMKYT